MVAYMGRYGEVARMETHSFIKAGWAFVAYYDLRAAMRAVEDNATGRAPWVRYHDKPEQLTRNTDDDAVTVGVGSGGVAGVDLRDAIRDACVAAFGPVRWTSDNGAPYLVRFWDVRHAREAVAFGHIFIPGEKSARRIAHFHATPLRPTRPRSRSRSRSRSPSRSRSRRPRSRSRSRSQSPVRRPRHRSPAPAPAPAPAPTASPAVVAEVMAQNQLLLALLHQQQQAAAPPPPPAAAAPNVVDLRNAILSAILGAPAAAVDPRRK